MRLDPFPRFPSDVGQLTRKLTDLFRDVAVQVNGVSEGKVSAVTNAYTAAPTSGTWAKGDYIRNSAPAEAGSASSKYVILGWICTVGGEPGTWLECRALTGN